MTAVAPVTASMPTESAASLPTPYARAALALASGIFVFIAADVTAQSLLFFAGGAVSPTATAVAFVVAIAITWVQLNGARLRTKALIAGGVIAITAAAVAFGAATVDISWDGNSYHKPAVGLLRDGWNPLKESVTAFNASPANPIHLATGHNAELWQVWVQHYPKASWIFGSSLYQLFGHIEVDKAIGPLSMVGLFLVGSALFSLLMGTVRAIVLGAVLALNPVSVDQVFSAYIDGVLGALVMAAMALLSLRLVPTWRPTGAARMTELITLSCVLIVLVDLKFTGLVYAAIVGVVYLIALAVRGGRKWFTAIRPVLIVGVAAAVIGVGIVGATSYVQNFTTTGNPVYPIGDGSLDAATGEVDTSVPADLKNADPFVQWALIDVASASGNPQTSRAIQLKVPFAISASEAKSFVDNAVRLGGFGPWYGGVLIVSIAAGIWLLLRYRRRAVPYLPIALAPFVVVAIGIPLVDGSWWARYAPQAFCLPIVIVAALWATRVRVLPWILSAALVVNLLVIGGVQAYEELHIVRHLPTPSELHAACGAHPAAPFQGVSYNLEDLGVRVLTDKELAQSTGDRVTSNYPYPIDGGLILVMGGCPPSR